MSSPTPSQKSALATRRALDALRDLLDVTDTASLPRDDARELAELVERLRPRLASVADSKAPVSPVRLFEPAARVYFDYALTGILETDQHWRVLRANPAAESITAVSYTHLTLPTIYSV